MDDLTPLRCAIGRSISFMVGIERTRAKLPESGSDDCSGALGVVLLFLAP